MRTEDNEGWHEAESITMSVVRPEAYSHDRHVHGGHVERRQHGLHHVLSVGRSFFEQDGVFSGATPSSGWDCVRNAVARAPHEARRMSRSAETKRTGSPRSWRPR